ncbi:hypothetical protein Pmani_008052 [Petrolisthes manimaculis]|uniref:Uncharacterized protein n=1 Tax=Petrolisthes manimaculis TaxID=1843537 RepID=A0AAE1UEZ4_9EUCA|nr:hypothetical protein Pmani_008052 [Petrolisthes manimaculis]
MKMGMVIFSLLRKEELLGCIRSSEDMDNDGQPCHVGRRWKRPWSIEDRRNGLGDSATGRGKGSQGLREDVGFNESLIQSSHVRDAGGGVLNVTKTFIAA